MDNSDILRRLTELLQERVGDTEAPISAQTRLQELGIDSIIQVDIMLDLETEFGFTFRSMSLPKDPTVAEIVDLVRASMAGSATA